jgi:hypothetical protein
MLQIDIIGSDGDNLLLEVGGRPNNGSSPASRNEIVSWRVREGINVDSITSISMKPTPGSVDIFSGGVQPARQGTAKHFQGRISATQEDYSVYIYKIMWVKTDGSGHTFDPIISIKPSLSPGLFIAPIVAFVGGAVASLLYWRQERIKLLAEIKRLKNKII